MTRPWNRYRIAAVLAVTVLSAGCATAIDGQPLAATAMPPGAGEPPPAPSESAPEAETGSTTPPEPTGEPEPSAEPDPFAPIVTATVTDGGGMTGWPARFDNVGHVIVPLRDVDGFPGPHLFAAGLHGPDTPVSDDDAIEIVWAVPFAEYCGFDAGLAGMVAAPLLDEDAAVVHLGSSSDDMLDRSEFAIFDNPLAIPQPGRTQECDAITLGNEKSAALIVGASADEGREPIIFWAGEEQLGVDDAWLDSIPAPGLIAGPVVAGDGSIWVAYVEDDDLVAAQLDVPSRELVPAATLPSADLATGQLAATADGFVGLVVGEDGTELVRVNPTGVAWQVTSPIVGTNLGFSSTPLAIDDLYVATYVTGEVVVVLDVDSGQVVAEVTSSSFNNNGDQVLLHEGHVVVGPFGSGNWLEAFEAATGEPTWSVPAPQDISTNDVKSLMSLGPGGVFVQSSTDEGVVLARIRFPSDS